MKRRLRVLVACLAVAAAAVPAMAQVPATFVMRSGERIGGELVDLGGHGYTITVSGQPRRVGTGELAIIDFAGAQDYTAEQGRLQPGLHLLVLRDGQALNGRLVDIGGRRPLRLTFEANGQNRDFSSDEVARIHLAAAPATSSSGQSGQASQPEIDNEGRIHVAAGRAWTSTALTVRRGQVVRFASSGQVRLSANAADVSGVAGQPGHAVGAGGLLPGQPGGALIGRIGNNPAFGIGDQASITMPAAGLLYLGVNDDYHGDNSGEFVVVLTTTQLQRGIRRER